MRKKQTKPDSNGLGRLKKVIVCVGLLFVMALMLVPAGCHIGGGTDTTLAGDKYEYSMKRQLKRLEEDYKQGNITRSEYESRKKRIEDGALIY